MLMLGVQLACCVRVTCRHQCMSLSCFPGTCSCYLSAWKTIVGALVAGRRAVVRFGDDTVGRGLIVRMRVRRPDGLVIRLAVSASPRARGHPHVLYVRVMRDGVC